MPVSRLPSGSLFQFTPLREGRRRQYLRLRAASVFQFTPLREGRHFYREAFDNLIDKFQFTPLREGRHGRGAGDGRGVRISIHAPPRGATAAKVKEVHAGTNFNSRPSARGDAAVRERQEADGTISIHAPPRGATCLCYIVLRFSIFQFTPLREGRRQKICNFCKSFVQPLQISMA